MAKEKTPPLESVTAAGLVEAIEQDVELSMEQVKEAAQEAIAAVEKKLARKPAKKKPPVIAKKARPTTKLAKSATLPALKGKKRK
jgi:hypothetical protein